MHWTYQQVPLVLYLHVNQLHVKWHAIKSILTFLFSNFFPKNIMRWTVTTDGSTKYYSNSVDLSVIYTLLEIYSGNIKLNSVRIDFPQIFLCVKIVKFNEHACV